MRKTIIVLLSASALGGCAGEPAYPATNQCVERYTREMPALARLRPVESGRLLAELQPGWMQPADPSSDGAEMSATHACVTASMDVHLIDGGIDASTIARTVNLHVQPAATDFRWLPTEPQMLFAVTYRNRVESGAIFVRQLGPETFAIVMASWQQSGGGFDPVIDAFAFALSLKLKDAPAAQPEE